MKSLAGAKTPDFIAMKPSRGKEIFELAENLQGLSPSWRNEVASNVNHLASLFT
jgi:hypothetical protein